MDISGLQKTTLLDYPGKVACTVFLSGCNMRCPFCHNASLVLENPQPQMTQEELLAFLKKRRGILDGVCVTGGEPTLRPGLPELLRQIKALGFLVKLDTNGTNPKILRAMLDEGLIDYVAMDIKNSPERYAATCGGAEVLEAVKESAAILMEGSAEYEFRTTCVAPFHDEDAMTQIGKWLSGAKAYYLQNFVDSGNLIGGGFSAFEQPELEEMAAVLRRYVTNVALRGV